MLIAVKRYFHTLAVGVCLTAPAQAARIEAQPLKDNPGSVFIMVSGDIEPGDDRRFIDAALAARDGMVVLSSGGGNLLAALEIGKAIRLKGFVTFVTDNTTCASACALAWLGGRVRLASDTSRIGFHAAYTEADGGRVPTGTGNALIGAYMTQLGYSQAAIIHVTSASPNEITWLKSDKAREIGIDVKSLNVNESGSSSGSGQRAASPPTPMTSDAPILSAGSFVGYGDWLQIFSRPTLGEAVVNRPGFAGGSVA